jgi:4-amino-4-deoxy-L-arabinose transferase-like glycosyltransferase
VLATTADQGPPPQSEWRARLEGSLDRLLDALADPVRGERAVLAVLVCYAGIWTLYGVIAKGSQDLHFDFGEMYSWSLDTSWATPKHPPLAPWLVHLWFTLFPRTDWAYYLFAMLVASLALWFAWRMLERYLDGEKRVVGLALLSFVPVFNFHALKFNNNAISLPTWAATTWLFLRAFETRRADFAALAGLAAGAAMLSKYWSIFLLAGLGIAALLDRRRHDYFRSAAPWITIGVGILVIAPHLVYVTTHGWRTFEWTFSSHPAVDEWAALRSALDYIAGTAGYAAAPVLITLIATRPAGAAIHDMLWPPEPDRRLVIFAFLVPLLLPALAALIVGGKLVSIWALAGLVPLPVILLSSRLILLTRTAALRILALAVALPLSALIVSPMVAFVIHRFGTDTDSPHYRLVAQAVEKVWRETTDQPLRIVGSYENLVSGTLFYYRDGPSAYDIAGPRMTPWIDDAQLARHGLAMVCPADNVMCMNALNARAALARGGKRAEVDISRYYLGSATPPQRFVIAIVPPGQ